MFILNKKILREKSVSDIATAIRSENKENSCFGYIAFHAPRYAMLLKILSEYITDSNFKVLDIGRSELTNLIEKTFNLSVDSLGFDEDCKIANSFHYHFDLNDTRFYDKWRRDIPQYNVIVMAEVIEHLYTSPLTVFGFIKTLMLQNSILIIQTPNAVALMKRITMLLGRNPYELIRKDITNPGHFREYTLSELISYARKSNFILEKYYFENYFDSRFPHGLDGSLIGKNRQGALLNLLNTLLPKRSMKPGITMVLRLPDK